MPLQQTGKSISFEGWFTASKQGAGGLAVTYAIARIGDPTVVIASGNASPVTALPGLYFCVLSGANTGPADDYLVVFSTTDNTVDFKQAPGRVSVGKTWVQDSLDNLIDSPSVRSGTAQAGGASTITLDAGASAVNDFYKDTVVKISSGTGAGQARIITGYVGGTQVATVSRAWATNPDNTSHFSIFALPLAPLDANLAVNANISGNVTVGGYADGQDPASLLLSNAAYKIAIDPLGRLTLTPTEHTSIQADADAALAARGVSAARMSYLDNANVGGPLASAAAVLNIQNNSYVSTNIPPMLERPDAGATTVSVTILVCDETGAPHDLDSGNPIIALVNDVGTDVSTRLSAISHPATGKYTLAYTCDHADAVEGVYWEITATVNTKLRRYVARTQIVDTTAVDFTSSDRNTLNGLASTLGNPAGASVSADVAALKTETDAVKAKTDNLPTQPAAVGSAMTLTSGERTSTANALLDLADAIEAGQTPRAAIRIMLAALAGKISGAGPGPGTLHVRNVGDTKDRLIVAYDANNNRTAVTVDGS